MQTRPGLQATPLVLLVALVHGRILRPGINGMITWRRWFGYHEIFHACTVVASGMHFAAVYLLVH